MRNLFTGFFLLATIVVIVCGLYPAFLWCIGQTIFPFQANGSLLKSKDGVIVGSKLIAQDFSKDEFFHPRPSAAAYNASASSSSSLAASNYKLRDRVAMALGPIVKYKNGQLVGPDIEKWVQQNLADNNKDVIDTLQNYAKQNNNKKPENVEMQSMFFEKWLQAHPNSDLQNIPADFVTTSASGLDPHITLQNAEMQLERVANAWALKLHRNLSEVQLEITTLLNNMAQAAFAGLAGEPYVNVLELNLELQNRYG